MARATDRLPCEAVSFLDIQEDAAASVLDGGSHPLLEKVARLGNAGKQPSHIERDFWRSMDRELPIDIDPYVCDAPKPHEGLGVTLKPHGFLLPHGVFDWLARHDIESLVYDAHLGKTGAIEYWGVQSLMKSGSGYMLTETVSLRTQVQRSR